MVLESEHIQRRNAYLRLFFMQVAVFFSGGVLMSMAAQAQFGLSLDVIGPLHFGIVLLLNLMIFLLLSKFFPLWAKILFGAGQILTHLIQILMMVFKSDLQNPEYWFQFSQLIMFIILLITLVTMTKDIFLHKHDIIYSLLGAANIYIGTPITFTTVYALLESMEPGLMGIEYANSGEMFFACYSYSWYVVTGLENEISAGVNSTLLNISAFESAIANLFIIFVVGRLMAK